MVTSLLYLGLFVSMPVAVLALLGALAGWLSGSAPRWPRAAPVRPAGTPSRRPLQDVVADLRRLAREIDRMASGASMVRQTAVQTAYDSVLVEAATLLDVAHGLDAAPPGVTRDVERLVLEAALQQAGLVVRS